MVRRNKSVSDVSIYLLQISYVGGGLFSTFNIYDSSLCEIRFVTVAENNFFFISMKKAPTIRSRSKMKNKNMYMCIYMYIQLKNTHTHTHLYSSVGKVLPSVQEIPVRFLGPGRSTEEGIC